MRKYRGLILAACIIAIAAGVGSAFYYFLAPRDEVVANTPTPPAPVRTSADGSVEKVNADEFVLGLDKRYDDRFNARFGDWRSADKAENAKKFDDFDKRITKLENRRYIVDPNSANVSTRAKDQSPAPAPQSRN